MIDADLNKGYDFFSANKIKLKEIRKTQVGSFDLYKVFPYEGTTISKITRNIDSFALCVGALKQPTYSIDFSAGSVDIKLQKREIGKLSLSTFLESGANKESKARGMQNPVILGYTGEGNSLVVDQSAIPNTLIAGAPGSGKSTILKMMIENFVHNNCIVTILDPKVVDFAVFKNKKGCNVYSQMEDITSALDSSIARMELIYKDLSRNGFSSAKHNNENNHSKILSEVIVIDECADIFLSRKECINKVLTLAQKGRAAGISIILATQRPSSTILPGQIKANFTGRIAMRVSSEMESRIILNNPHAAHISEPGMAYYLDQSLSEPIYFRVTENDLLPKDVAPKTFSFWENLLKLF